MIQLLFLILPLFLSASVPEMTLDEKIGQLFMAPACPLRGNDHWADWQKLMKECHVGNAIVKESDPISQVKFLNRLQVESKVPLLVAADAEWGLAMRMSNTIAFPRNMTLGAIQALNLIRQMGQIIGQQAKLVGIQMNLAPVADINNNPANPVIHMRSFGENPHRVAACVSAFSQGLQSSGILACAKHFPGHGDTNVDSHRGLPVINHPLERLEVIEFVPFKQLIEEGISALMTAHLYVPALDPVYPTSLSSLCMKGIARDELHFEGLIISDALNMKAIVDRYSPEEIALLARKAGCDLLLYGDHIAPNVDEIIREMIPRAFQALKKAYLSGELDVKDLDASVSRILAAKQNINPSLPLGDLLASLHMPNALDLKKQLFQEAITLIGEPAFPLQEEVIYWNVKDPFPTTPYDQIVIEVDSKEVLTEKILSQIESLADRSILCLYASPYLLKHFKGQKTILIAYENDPDAKLAVQNILVGKEEAKGHLPITIDGL